MIESRTFRPVLRGLGAVLAGLLIVALFSTIVDVVLHATGVFPRWGEPMADALFALAFAYRVVFAIAGGYLAARLAPDRPMSHALALGAVGLIVSVAGAIATWSAGPAFGPHWYPLALVATSIPCAWAGGSLRAARVSAS